MKFLQLSRGGARMMAFGIFDSVEMGEELATEENVQQHTSFEESLQVVEPDVVGVVLPAAG